MAISKSRLGEDEEWNKLPQAEKDAIVEGLAQIERGETLSHEEFLARFSKWFKKNTNTPE